MLIACKQNFLRFLKSFLTFPIELEGDITKVTLFLSIQNPYGNLKIN